VEAIMAITDEGTTDPTHGSFAEGDTLSASALARKKAEALGLPYTPMMRLEDAQAGVRAVDGLGRIGTFLAQTFEEGPGMVKVKVLFEPDSPPAVHPDAGDLEDYRRITSTEASAADMTARAKSVMIGVAPSEDEPLHAPASWHDAPGTEPPYFDAPDWFRNGREAGAWAAALAFTHGRVHVRLPADRVPGATTSLVDAGLVVGRYSGPGDDGGVTLQVVDPSAVTFSPV
jgi:hypothetical protein